MQTVKTEFGDVFHGDVVESAKYDPPHTIRMTTDISDFPFRVIYLKQISEVDGKAYWFDEPQEITRQFVGSNGVIYTTTLNHCTCPGYTFRKTCKHINELQKDVVKFND